LQRAPNPVLLNTIFSALAAEKYLINLEPKVCASRLAHYLSEINAIHPFREGNGRVQRLFISQLAEHAGYSLDYSSLDQAVLYPVMQASFLGNEQPLSDLIFKIIA
jgi:cell filamentation protein